MFSSSFRYRAFSHCQPQSSTAALALADTLDIGLVTETFPPEVNGVAMTLGRLATGLRAAGHRVRIYRPRQTEKPGMPAGESGDEILLSGMRLPMYRDLRLGLPAGRRLTESWRGQRPDVVYVATEGPLGWSAVHCARSLGIPVVSGFHTNFHTYTRHYRLGWLEPLIRGYLRRLHRATDCTLVPTGALAERLRQDRFGNVRVLARGVDTDLFNPGRRCAALRQQWGVHDDTLVCLYVGRIAAEKNIDEAAAAASGLRNSFPKARFVLVGDGPLRPALTRRYPDFVYCGTRTGTELARHYASADVFLFPSRSETFGNVVTEAMASGLTVIAYDEAAAREHIRHERNGLLVRDGNSPKFAETLLRLYRDPAQARRLGHSAARDCETLGWKLVVERFASLLRDTTASASQRPALMS